MFKLVPLDFTNRAHNDALDQLKSLSLFKEVSSTKVTIEVDKRNYFDEETIEKNVEQISGSYSSLSKLILRRILPKEEWTAFISKKDQFSLSAIIIGEVNSIWPLVRQYSSSPFFNKDENELLKKKILCHIVQTSEDLFEDFCFRMKSTCDLAAFSRDANLTRIKAQINLEAVKRFNIVSVARNFQEDIAAASNPERKKKQRISTIPTFRKFRAKRQHLPSIQVEIKQMQDEMPTLNLHQLKSLIPSGGIRRFPSTIVPEKTPYEEEEVAEHRSPTPEHRPYLLKKCDSARELRKITLIEEIAQDLYEFRENKSPDIEQERPQSADADMGRKKLPKSTEAPDDIEEEEEDPEADIPPLIQAISRREEQTKRLESLNEQIVALDKKAEHEMNNVKPIPPPKYPQPSVIQTKVPHWKTKQTVVSQMFDCQLNDTIDPSAVILTSHKPLFNELSGDIPSTVVKELDSNLYRDGELKEVYAEILKTVHDSYLRFDDDEIVVEPAQISELDIKLLLDSSQPVEVINPKLDTGSRPLQLNRPHLSDDMSDISKNAQLMRHVYEAHNHGDGKAYASWLTWWKATITTDDYFKFLAFQKLDYLHVSFHFYGDNLDADNELLAAMLEEKRKRMEQLQELRNEKFSYSKGMWNVNAVLMGGLGREPELPEEVKKPESSPRSRSSRSGSVRPSAATEGPSSSVSSSEDNLTSSSSGSSIETATSKNIIRVVLGSSSEESLSGSSTSSDSVFSEESALITGSSSSSETAVSSESVQSSESAMSSSLLTSTAGDKSFDDKTLLENTETSSGFGSMIESSVKENKKVSFVEALKQEDGRRRSSVREIQLFKQRRRFQSIIRKNLFVKMRTMKAWQNASSTPRSQESEKKPSEDPWKHSQGRLEVIWKTLKMNDQERLTYALKYSSDQFINILPHIVNAWEKAVDAIVAREKVLAELELFEEEASDPNRFFSRGRNVRLLEEAKIRSKLYKKLKTLEKVAFAFVMEVQERFNDTVTYNGRDYIDKMRNDKTEMLFWLQQKRRQKILINEDATTTPEAHQMKHVSLNDGI